MAIEFDADGLVPAIVQDASTGAVLMLGYMNAESFEKTRRDGRVWFWSRSRNALWMKGETSGNVLNVREIRQDCDGDAILVMADPAGPTCHTNEVSCFHRMLDSETILATPYPAESVLGELFGVIRARQRTLPAGSYTTYLFEKGVDKIGKKIGEEAAEVIIAAKNGDPGPLAGEVADLLYHTLVMLAACGVEPGAVYDILKERRK